MTIPVFTSNVDHDEVRTAMESVPDNDVQEWLKENIGESFLARRKQAFKLKNKNKVKKN